MIGGRVRGLMGGNAYCGAGWRGLEMTCGEMRRDVGGVLS